MCNVKGTTCVKVQIVGYVDDGCGYDLKANGLARQQSEHGHDYDHQEECSSEGANDDEHEVPKKEVVTNSDK